MTTENILQDQGTRDAIVEALDRNLMVLAGAGAGKTHALIERMVRSVRDGQAEVDRIAAITITRKAAGEMRGRLEPMLRIPARSLWVGTFHGIAHRLLRMHFKEAGLPQAFQILDSDDQLRLVKRAMRGLGVDEQRWPPKQMAGFINSCKDAAERPGDLADNGDYARTQMIAIYKAYETAREAAGLVDFPELLLRAYEICRDDASLLAHYRKRFSHIMVDEFQDTNALQYAWDNGCYKVMLQTGSKRVSTHNFYKSCGFDGEEKFGYIFIVCATGKTADEMLAILERRLESAPLEELPIAAGEQWKITELRLKKLVL